MAKSNILDVIVKTINDVQQKNKTNPKEPTADSTVFDLLKNKIQQLDERNKAKRVAKGKSPVSILDRIRKEIEGARKENKQDPNVETAPKSIFEKIIKKVDQAQARPASTGVRRVLDQYNLDISNLPPQMIKEIQSRYNNDLQKLDNEYAKAINQLIKRAK